MEHCYSSRIVTRGVIRGCSPGTHGQGDFQGHMQRLHRCAAPAAQFILLQDTRNVGTDYRTTEELFP